MKQVLIPAIACLLSYASYAQSQLANPKTNTKALTHNEVTTYPAEAVHIARAGPRGVARPARVNRPVNRPANRPIHHPNYRPHKVNNVTRSAIRYRTINGQRMRYYTLGSGIVLIAGARCYLDNDRYGTVSNNRCCIGANCYTSFYVQ